MKIIEDEDYYFNDHLVNIFGKELINDYDKFNKQKYLEGTLGLAKVIQNLIIIEPGTYPNRPDLGVGISKYLFEPLNDVTIEKIRDNINVQINRYVGYINGDIECEISIKPESFNSSHNILIIKIIISKDNNNLKKDYYGFNLLFGINKITNKLVSKIIF